VLLDAGATVECKPQHLLQFAHMGAMYARVGARHRDGRRIGLLSIGEEETKGNELTRDAHQRLKASELRSSGTSKPGAFLRATPTWWCATASPATSR
jgi:glycerol-3-phosphate acyltransferase PlsX